MRVDHRRSHVVVPEQRLNRADVRPALQQVRGKCRNVCALTCLAISPLRTATLIALLITFAERAGSRSENAIRRTYGCFREAE